MSHPHPLPELPPRYVLWPSPDRALLGTGGASAVWRVQDEALGLLVALKVLKSEGRRFHARLEREAMLSSKVVHPNVVALHDVGRTPDGRSYLAFALASDGSMLDLAPAPPPWPELKDLIIQLLRALAALHARNILHLDVKLSNLLLHRGRSGRRQLWLADLGVARALYGEDDDDKAVIGTVSYMAPERLTGQHHLWCPATDLFAVGAVVFRLLTGRLPYPARDPSEGMAQRMHPPDEMQIRSGLKVPPRLDQVILPMLQPDPRARYDLAADVIRALESLPERPEAMAGPAGPWRRGAETDSEEMFSELQSQVSEPGSSNPAGAPKIRPDRGVPPWYKPPPLIPPEYLRRPEPPRRIPQAPSLLVHREIRLVGRELEFDLLWRAARTAMRTRRPLLLELTGPRGVGRTRLVDEFLRLLEEIGIGEGVTMEYAVAKGPDIGLAGAWRRIVPPGSRRETYILEIASLLARDRGARIEDCLPDAEALARWISPKPGDDPTWNRSTVRSMLVEHLERRAWRGISWLRIEDGHLAGENDDCWPIVDQLLGRSTPALVLVTTRGEGLSPSLLELRARHHRAVRTIEVQPLPPQLSEELVEAHLPLEPALKQRVAAHGQGNPRAIHELLAWWIGSGKLVEDESPVAAGRAWTLHPSVTALPADQREFALARLQEVKDDPERLRALEVLALSGAGTPESVLQRLAGEAVDRLVVDRLVDLERGQLALNPPELCDVVKETMLRERINRGDPAWKQLQAELAEAWAAEDENPEVLARVGSHRQDAGDEARALDPLDRALRGLHQTMPVPQVCELAGRVIGAAEATGQRGSPAWTHAALVLADARWRRGDDAGALPVDAALAQVPLSPAATVQVACARLWRVGPARTEALKDMERIKPLLADLAPHHRAEYFTTLALVRSWRLDVEGALAELHNALANRPRPDAACRARLLRARLLQAIDPVIGWHETLRTIEVARDHGLLRYEVLAWGLAGVDMVTLGRGDEAVERLRTGVARLEAHGEYRAALEARLHLGATLRAAGRNADARKVWADILDSGPPPFGTFATDARAALGVLAALEQKPDAVQELLPEKPSWAGPAVAWALLLPLARLIRGDETSPPRQEALSRAAAIGSDGLFLARAVADLLALRNRPDEAGEVQRLLVEGCARLGLDPQEGDPLLQRFHRARR